MNNNPIKFPVCPPNMAEVTSAQTVAGIKALTNTFVHVTDINTVFFVDNQHRITQICAFPIFQDNYDYKTNPLGLRSQIVYDFTNNLMIIFNPQGEYRIVTMINHQGGSLIY